MRTPPLLMGGALLFWGWENGFLLWAALLATVLEGSRLTRIRWEFSDTDLKRISDLCCALFVGTVLLMYSSENRLLIIFKFTQWLPFCFFPLMLAQAYGNRATMPLSTFWWLLRRSPDSPAARKSYNISYCYFAFCLLAASVSTQANEFFYPGITLLVALALISTRPRRLPLSLWVALMALTATAGQFGHQELRQIQSAMEGAMGAWFADLFRSSMDMKECPTQIARSGQIALSHKIVLRLRPEPGGFVPALLREGTWDAYKKESWLAGSNDFTQVHMGGTDTAKLMPTNALSSQVEIARYYENGEGVLALPHGTFEIDDIPASVKTNRLGVTMIDNGPGLLDMHVSFGPSLSFDSPPGDRDLVVPEEEKPMLAGLVSQLKLEGMTERQKIRTIEQYFETQFTYSLNAPRHREPTWLAYFLSTSHSGHCEYFATATVLLLRQAGVYARYATGYAVPESARHGDAYLVRAQHAHAWALGYRRDMGLWEEIDTTPSNWDKAEEARPPWWESASDALSNLYFQFSKWRWSRTSYARYTSWLLAPMILYLFGRIVWNQRRQRLAAGADDPANRAPWPGLDSELYLINRQLAFAQLSRLPNEPLRSWQERLELAFPDSDRLRLIFHLHRCLRFDPRGLKNDDRETLRNEAQRWLADFTVRAQQKKPAPLSGPLQAHG